jgi:putative transposon-encoded protein
MPRKVEVKEGNFSIGENVEVVFEKTVTPFGCSAKLDVPKKHIGKRAYVIVVKD